VVLVDDRIVIYRDSEFMRHDSYMTPPVWTQGDQLEVVIATWKTLAGFAVSDGSMHWMHSYPRLLAFFL
jgi:hypothetical protein